MTTTDDRHLCARYKKRHPELCSFAVFGAGCECGKVYRRCANHGGSDGAIKSRGSHRGIDCPNRLATPLQREEPR